MRRLAILREREREMDTNNFDAKMMARLFALLENDNKNVRGGGSSRSCGIS